MTPEQQKALALARARRRRAEAEGGRPTRAGNAGMLTESTISREEYLRDRGGVGFGGRPMPADLGRGDGIPEPNRVYETVQTDPLGLRSLRAAAGLGDKTGGPYGGSEKIAGSGSILGIMPEKPQFFDIFGKPAKIEEEWTGEDQWTGVVPERMSRAQSVAIGVNDLNPAQLVMGDRGYDAAVTQSLQDNPFSTRLGQTAALTGGGGAQLTSRAIVAAPKLVAPAVAARVAGQSAAAQATRLLGRGAVLAGTGAADFYAYNALAEAPNLWREAGSADPSFGERVDFANSQVFTPGGAISALAGPASSLIYRGGRAAVSATKNAVTSGGRTALRPGTTSATPVADLFTPADVQRRVAGMSGTLSTMTRDDATKAIDMLLKRGFDPDEAEKMVRFLDYAGKSEVPEMLFQIMPNLRKVDQLTVALGTVGGEAQQALATALGKQAQDSPGVLRDALRKAMGIAGEDFYAMQKGIRADQLDAPREGYNAAYGKEVSDDTWENQILPQLRTKYGREAVADAADYAEGIAGTDPAQLAVARQLAQLRDALGGQGAAPGKVSTQSLDYIDRMLGDVAQGIKSGSGRRELAKGPVGTQRGIRGDANAGLDVETGLDAPRRLSAELKTAEEALEFGRKAFRSGTDIETLQDEFGSAIAKLGQDGGESETVRGALLMGWLRGAEDEISVATNAQSVIRRIYGSERQREKLLAMMPELGDDAAAGIKGSNTKDIRALVGGRRDDGREMAGMIDRLKRISGDYNRIIGNSQTAQRAEAVAEQGGTQDKLNFLMDAVLNTRQAAVTVARTVVNRMARPGIYQPGVNRELGRLLTTRGKKQLLAVIEEIRQRQAATGKGPKPQGGAPAPPAPKSGPSAPPVIRAGGFMIPSGKEALRTIAKDGIAGGGGALAAGDVDLNADGKKDWNDRAIGAAMGVGVRRLASPLFKGVLDGMNPTYLPKVPRDASPAQKPASPQEIRFDKMRQSVEGAARKNGEELTPEEIERRAVEQYRAIYKEQPSHLPKDPELFERAWVRAVDDAIIELEDTMGPGNYTAYDVESLAANMFPHGRFRLPKNTLRLPADRVPGTVDPNDPNLTANGFAAALSDDLGRGVAGGIAGGIAPVPSTGDWKEDARNRLIAIAGGATLGVAGPRMAARYAQRGAGKVATAGFFGSKKKPPLPPRQIPPGVAPDTSPETLFDLHLARVVKVAEVLRPGDKAAQTRVYERAVKYLLQTYPDKWDDIAMVYPDRDELRALTVLMKEVNPRGYESYMQRRLDGAGKADEVFERLEAALERQRDLLDVQKIRPNGFVPTGKGPRLGRNAGDPSQQELPKAPAQTETRGRISVPPTPHTEGWYRRVWGSDRSDRMGSSWRDPDGPKSARGTAVRIAQRIAKARPNINALAAVRAPGRMVASGMRAADRRLRSPEDPRLLQPTIAAGKMSVPPSGKVPPTRPAIERMKEPGKPIDALVLAQRRAEKAYGPEKADGIVPGRTERALETMKRVEGYFAGITQRIDDMRSQGLSTQELKEAVKARSDITAAYHDAWRKVLTARKSGDASAIRTAETEVAKINAVREALKKPPGQPRELSQLERIDAEIKRAMNDVGVPDTRFSPHGRQLRSDAEVADLLTNPARAQDAANVSRAKPLGTHEIKGQAAVAGATGAAGAGLYLSAQEAKRERDKDWFEGYDEFAATSKHLAYVEGDELSEMQNFLNRVVPMEAGEKPLQPDGKFGVPGKSSTSARIRRYQKMRGLTVNGRMTTETRRDLQAQIALAIEQYEPSDQ